MTAVLEARDVCVSFGGLRALDGVDMSLAEGEILGLIGPNGAGKTTLLNVLSGLQRASRGSLQLAGRDMTRWDAARRARAGLGRTFQDVRLFSGMSVLENCEAAGVGCGRRRASARSEALQALQWLGLEAEAGTGAARLPYGLQRKAGIARALCARPTVLLLDEPAAGLNDGERAELGETILNIRRSYGCALVVIEHDMRTIFGVCDRVHVLDHGVTLTIGTPQEVREDAEVVRAYLGDGAQL
jgi:branched-chain amino acid transport system ATP-binding protein